jgi:hypothetical protein
MANESDLKRGIIDAVSSLAGSGILIEEETPLIGGDGVLSSMKLVELCLIMEDMAADIDFDFDWTSESAMSKSRSIFLTVGSITNEFISQMKSKK